MAAPFQPLVSSSSGISGTYNVDFAAAVSSWAEQAEEKLTSIFRKATHRLADTAIEGAPVATGELRDSARASLEQMPQFYMPTPHRRGAGRANLNSGSGAHETIEQAEIGQTIYVGFTAPYSIFVEYGTYKMPPRGFVRLAVAQWTSIVSESIRG